MGTAFAWQEAMLRCQVYLRITIGMYSQHRQSDKCCQQNSSLNFNDWLVRIARELRNCIRRSLASWNTASIKVRLLSTSISSKPKKPTLSHAAIHRNIPSATSSPRSSRTNPSKRPGTKPRKRSASPKSSLRSARRTQTPAGRRPRRYSTYVCFVFYTLHSFPFFSLLL